MDPDQLADALVRIDAANADDPTTVTVEGRSMPLAVAHGRLADEWLCSQIPDIAATWRIAARAHHLRRFATPRSAYPKGRGGYLRWRRDQKIRHADECRELLAPVGLSTAELDEVSELILRTPPDKSAGTQAIEDAACAAFMRTQLGDVAAGLNPARAAEVIVATLAKMSTEARHSLAQLRPPDGADSAMAWAWMLEANRTIDRLGGTDVKRRVLEALPPLPGA